MAFPPDVAASIKELEVHYADFDGNDRGANGYLLFAKNRVSQADVAIKFYAGAAGERRHDEPRLLSAIDSPNVLPIYDARIVSDDWAYFITPRCNEGDIDDLIGTRPGVHNAIDVLLGISRGVSVIHTRGMVHRDLKPGNIVMDRGTPRIADFGSVRILENGTEETTASQHSILYRPPESFATNRYSRRGDVYQVGLVTYQLLGGTLPYDGTQYLSRGERRDYDAISDDVDRSLLVDGAIRRRAETGSLINANTLPPWISNHAKRGIRAMTHPDPRQRLTSMADVAAALSAMRTTLSNWRFIGTTAQMSAPDRIIELRLLEPNHYESFQQKTGGFRRMPGMEPSTLADLVKRCSA